jgi:hypothetical protein
MDNQDLRMDLFESQFISLRDHLEDSIISSIPDNMVSRLEELLTKNDAESAAERAVLEEKATIERNSELMEYYIAVQTYLNGVFLACGVISSGMVANQDTGVAGKASWFVDKFAQHASLVPGANNALDAVNPWLIPALSLAFDVASTSLSACDDYVQKPMVERVASVCMNDPAFISQVTESVARKMALFLGSKLPGGKQVDSKLSGKSIPERIRDYLGSSEVKKDQALEHVQAVIGAIKDGTLTVERGNVNSVANAIVEHLMKTVKLA